MTLSNSSLAKETATTSKQLVEQYWGTETGVSGVLTTVTPVSGEWMVVEARVVVPREVHLE